MNQYFKLFQQSTLMILIIFMSVFSSAQESLTYQLKFKNETLTSQLTFLQKPVIGTEITAELQFFDSNTLTLVSPQESITIELWMPSMGHGSAPTHIEAVTDENGNIITGRYLVRSVYFIMGGDWEVYLTLTDSTGQQESRSFNISIAEKQGHGGGHHH